MPASFLVIACGALAREIGALKRANGWDHLYIQCLDAALHNRPDEIPGRVEALLESYAEQYDHRFVAYADCGTGGRLDAVLEHWRKIAPADAVAERAWVALKHEITYRKPAFLEDDVIARTVLESVKGARAFYHTVIARGEDVLAEVRSSWCCIDAETLRPARITDEIARFFFPEEKA